MIRGILRYVGAKDVVTLLNACSGALSIAAAAAGQVELACGLIFLAALFDLLDGAVARSTGANPFGKELDSLCDAVSFGAAPALLAFILSPSSFAAVLVPLIYLSCGILRLARFNVTRQANFTGVPIPAAAVTTASLALAGVPAGALLAAQLALAFLMVSDIEYRSQKGLSSRQLALLSSLGVAAYLAAASLGRGVLGALSSAVCLAYLLSPLALGLRVALPEGEEDGGRKGPG